MCPSPSGLLISFSIEIPCATSVLNCSSDMLLPLIFTVMSSAAGASNRPGISSVNLIRLIGEEPSLVIVTVADKSCLL